MSGKGSRQRATNKKKFDANWDVIFGKDRLTKENRKSQNNGKNDRQAVAKGSSRI